MTIDQKKEILNYLHKNDVKIVECLEGSHINLDKLNDDVLQGLIDMVSEIMCRTVPTEHLIWQPDEL